ncbi:15-hydroxyprostaglandin dehydrogenase [NAD(+)]-like [Bicyclus anynana]|uniref:15-hydroxyprostaglandin dehydrogenase [NAD(+)]-like n=1 Tax=Bicyclus anynana TaxID=110368 RepID=A0A6J1NR48_BICAN|nr:15-hydroxyprostaglandin dehydrogenase [NAD(+)]-like [Bicyclus anynana]
MYSLIDKVAIVTGGANGIGAQIVQGFVKERIKYVAILDIDEASGVTLKNKLNTEYGSDVAGFFKCNITVDEELFITYDEIFKKFGVIDIVVNNAGVASEKMDTYKNEIAINFTASVSSTLKALELMRVDRGGAGGTIINVSSIAALTLMSPSLFVYGATKSAILHLSVCMGKEDYYRHTKVRVLAICFGGTETALVHKTEGLDDIVNESMHKLVDSLIQQSFLQTANAAARGVVEAYQTSASGNVWLVDNDNAVNITDRIYGAYKILSDGVHI